MVDLLALPVRAGSLTDHRLEETTAATPRDLASLRRGGGDLEFFCETSAEWNSAVENATLFYKPSGLNNGAANLYTLQADSLQGAL